MTAFGIRNEQTWEDVKKRFYVPPGNSYLLLTLWT
jgi:hypothetical protein